MPEGMNGMMDGMGAWMMILWGLLGFAIAVLGVVGVMALLRSGGGLNRRSSSDGETPEEILRRHYASGEISEDEYQQRLSRLRQE